MARLSKKELEEKLQLAQRLGATPEQVEQRRRQYKEADLVKFSDAPLVNLTYNIGKGIAKIPMEYGGLVLEAGRQGLNQINPEYRSISKRLDSGKVSEDEIKKFQELNRPKFMKAKAVADISGKPLKGGFYGAKKGVGTWATVAPFAAPKMAAGALLGGKATSAAQAGLRGAVYGGARGFGEGEADVGKTLIQTGVGAGAGYLTGAGLYKAGDWLGKLKERQANKVSKGVDLKGTALEKDDPFFASKKKDLDAVVKDIGLNKKMTPFQQVEQLEPGFNRYDSELKNILKEYTGKPVDKDKILNNFVESVNRYVEFDDTVKGNRFFMDNLLDKIDSITDVDSLYAAKQEASQMLKHGVKGSAKNQIHKALFRSFQDALADVDPNIGVINNKERALFNIAEELVKNYQGDVPARLNFPGVDDLGFNLPITKGQAGAGFSRLGDTLMKPVQGALNVAGSAGSRDVLRDVLAQEAGGLATKERGTPLQRLDSSIGGAPQGGMVQGSQVPQGPISYFEATQMAPQLMKQYGEDVMRKLWIIHPSGKAIWNPMTQSFIEYDSKSFGGSGEVSKEQANAQSGLRAIDSLKSALYSGDEVNRGVMASRILPLQGLNTKAQMLKTAGDEIQDVLQRMRTGAAINNAEWKRYSGMLPKITDTDETIAYKLDLFENLFKSIGGY